MGGIVVRLKAIEYKEDSFCYLSSYPPDLGLQAACLQTLFFRPLAFRTSYPRRNTFAQASDPRSVPTIWTLSRSLSPSLTRCQRPAWWHRGCQLLSCYCIKLQSGWSNTREPYSLRPTSRASHHPHGGSKGLGLRVDRGRFLATSQATDLGWGLICRMTASSARNLKAIRGDLDPNGIESRKAASQQMGCWWVDIETAVGWR